MSAEAATTPQLSQGEAIEYKAYARSFGEEPGAVLYLIATCAYPIGGYQLFFEAEEGGTSFKLMEIPPKIFPQLVTYYMAIWTSGQPAVDPLTEITVTDAYGSHPVTVQPWD